MRRQVSRLLHACGCALIDIPAHTALAAVSCFRSLAGFGFPLFAPVMYNALGYGKGNTILAAVFFAIGPPSCVYILPASRRLQFADWTTLKRILILEIWRKDSSDESAGKENANAAAYPSTW